ncbi:MAG: divalent-cation tolerance protein CutA [Betaproteobacteria bacterium]|nr:divalent-cation tolerance protein CutA [Betaproteobacteria bacterium]
MSDKVLILLCNLPDLANAERIAALAIEQRLAACVNILPSCKSVYRWKGKIEQAEEIPVLFKTSARAYPELETLICAEHPYELPEILALQPAEGLKAYLNWIASEAAPENSLPDGL